MYINKLIPPLFRSNAQGVNEIGILINTMYQVIQYDVITRLERMILSVLIQYTFYPFQCLPLLPQKEYSIQKINYL